MLAIQKGNHNFGTTSHCRVPLRLRAAQVGGRARVRAGAPCVAAAGAECGRFWHPAFAPWRH
jgi:bud site selection protein 31